AERCPLLAVISFDAPILVVLVQVIAAAFGHKESLLYHCLPPIGSPGGVGNGLVACLTASGRFKNRSMSSCVARRCASELAVALSIVFRPGRAAVASARASGDAFSSPARSIKRRAVRLCTERWMARW